MTVARIAPDSRQPAEFAFTPENMKRVETILARYPANRKASAMIPLLDLAQRQNGNWLPRAAMDHVADLLGVPRIRAYEVATFYTMFNKAPVASNLIQVCTTTPCWLCGSSEILRAIKDRAGATPGHGDPGGLFTVVEVECLGACVNAPMVQINDDYFEDLDYDRMCAIIDALKADEPLPPGSQTGRRGSQAQAGPTSLLDRAPEKIRPATAPDGQE